jgi:hypothetical protein
MASALYGLLAEFETPEHLAKAAAAARDAGYRRMEAYTPFPVHGMTEALGFRPSRLASLVLLGGVVGALSAFALQYWVSAVAYPLNVGGRPLNSWPSFVPVTFEVTILVASLTAVLGMLALNGLPRPHHPLFGVERFQHASRDAFFLCIEAADPRFDPAATRRFLESLEPRGIHEVAP